METGSSPGPHQGAFDFEAFFHSHYDRIARAVARVVGDPARAEDLAAEAFWKLWQTPQAQGEKAGGWLYRTALRMALNESAGERPAQPLRAADPDFTKWAVDPGGGARSRGRTGACAPGTGSA